MRRQYMLPDGTHTRSAQEYADAWRALAAPIAQALGGYLHSFDPGITIGIMGRGRSVALDLDVARKLSAALEKSS